MIAPCEPPPKGYVTLREAQTRSGIHLGVLRRDQHCGKIASTKIGSSVFVRFDSLDRLTAEWHFRSHCKVAGPVAAVAGLLPRLPDLRTLLEALQAS